MTHPTDILIIGIASLILSSCFTMHQEKDDINIELTCFANDLVSAYADSYCDNLSMDSTSTFVFRCYENAFCLFCYKNFSHKNLVGKAIAEGRLVKIYGADNPTIYHMLHKSRDREYSDTDGNYVEDLNEWSLITSSDTIIIDMYDYNKKNVKCIKSVCKKHFPDKILILRRTSFRLDDIIL